MSKIDPLCPDVLINPPGVVNRFRGEWFFLSNYGPGEVQFEGVVYPRVEHAWHASKTLDLGKRELIRAGTANQARILGRSALISLEDLEETSKTYLGYVRNGRLEEAIRDKAFRNPLVRKKLMASGACPIIEGRVPTRFGGWHGSTLPNGEGPNTLGQIWMRVRAGM